jgi:hypothetical protein
MTDTIKSLAEYAAWAGAHDSGIPPRMVLGAINEPSMIERLRALMWRTECSERSARREAEHQDMIAAGCAARLKVYRDALAKLIEDEELMAEEMAAEAAEQERQDNSQFGVGA